MRVDSYSLIAVALIGLVLIAVAVACGVSEGEAEQAEIDIAGAPIEVRVTALRLAEDYEANEVAANQKYDGRVLAVSGTVEAVSGGDSGEAYYVDLSTGSFSLTSVRCHFSESHLGDITSIRKGDRVTLRGKGDEGKDRDPFTIDVIGCSVIPEATSNTPKATDTPQPTPTAQSDAIPMATDAPAASVASPASTPETQQIRAETPTPTPEIVQSPVGTPTQPQTPTAIPTKESRPAQIPTPTTMATPSPTTMPIATPTAIPNAFLSVSGQGTDIRFVDLPAGQWVVQTDLSDNTDNELTRIQVGGDYIMVVFDKSWSGRSLINVGTEYFEIPPGRTPIETEAAPGASWTITFVDPPPASDPAEPIVGQGQDVKFVDLTEGEWVVEIEVSGNKGYLLDSFDVDIGGMNVVDESGPTWSGRKLVTVGSAYDEIPPGSMPIEVRAESNATWTIQFIEASSLPVSDFSGRFSGQGTDIRFVDLPAGQWVVQTDLSDNTDNELTRIRLGATTLWWCSISRGAADRLLTLGQNTSKSLPAGPPLRRRLHRALPGR